MIKLRNNVDLEYLIKYYGFEKVKNVEDYLIYIDDSFNSMIIYPFADRLIEILISSGCSTCVNGSNRKKLIDISKSGVMDMLTKFLNNNMLFIEEAK